MTHDLREQGSEVWKLLDQGAHLYVCGDAKMMAKVFTTPGIGQIRNPKISVNSVHSPGCAKHCDGGVQRARRDVGNRRRVLC